ncbi:MAG: PEP-CTERM sorting domain-containing protein [Nitrospirae bacterium]|nr:MAG: PEP-CTERM sorting domain-containing protein [Nitrospirota bacterium]
MGILGKFTSVKAITIMLLMGAVAFSSEVRADLTPSLSTVTGSGSFVFTYSVTLSSAERVNTGAIPGISVNTGVGVLGSTYASFFTIYDFGGFVAGSNTQPAGWSFQSLAGNVGSTPSNTVPTDSASLPNLTWFWTGGVAPPAPGTVAGLFSATSTLGNQLVLHNFASAATQNATDATDGTAVSTVGSVATPAANPPPPGVPEPTTLLLLGSGLAGLAGWRRWRAQK